MLLRKHVKIRQVDENSSLPCLAIKNEHRPECGHLKDANKTLLTSTHQVARQKTEVADELQNMLLNMYIS